jgi:hypothetical protein
MNASAATVAVHGRSFGDQRHRQDESAGKTFFAIVPSFSQRYLSTALFEGIG